MISPSGPGLEHAGGRYRLLAACWGKHRTGEIVDLDDEQARRLVQPGIFEPASAPAPIDWAGGARDVVGVPNFPVVASSDPGPMAVTVSPLLSHPAVVGLRPASRRRRRG